MRFFRNRIMLFTIIISIILVIVIGFTLGGRTRPSTFESTLGSFLAPIQKFFYNLGTSITNNFGALLELKDLKKTNELLNEEILELKEENRALYQMALENKRLREILNFTEKNTQYDYIGAKITGKDPGNWFNVFTIDRGSKHSIEVNDPVITGQGLVGRVIEVGNSYSKVMSVIDGRSSISIIVNRTRDSGIVSGSTNAELIAVMPLESDIVKGDDIITSSFSTLPAGLYIGKVGTVEKVERKLQKIVTIDTSVDFKRLEEVFVVKQDKELD